MRDLTRVPDAVGPPHPHDDAQAWSTAPSRSLPATTQPRNSRATRSSLRSPCWGPRCTTTIGQARSVIVMGRCCLDVYKSTDHPKASLEGSGGSGDEQPPKMLEQVAAPHRSMDRRSEITPSFLQECSPEHFRIDFNASTGQLLTNSWPALAPFESVRYTLAKIIRLRPRFRRTWPADAWTTSQR